MSQTVGRSSLRPTPPLAPLNGVGELVEAQPGWRRIGQILIDLDYLEQRGLDAALAEQSRRGPHRPIGLLDLLVEQGAITPDQARHALTEQILTQYLPALAASLQRERRLAAEAAATREELDASYSTALRTIAALQEQEQELRHLVTTQADRLSALTARRDKVPPSRGAGRLLRPSGPARLALSAGALLVLGLVVVLAWTVVPTLADRAARPFILVSEPVRTPSPPVSTASPRPAPPATQVPDQVLRATETELALLLMGGRVAHDGSALRLNPALSVIAQRRSEDMATRNYFSHEIPPENTTVLDLLTRAGIPYAEAGEILEFNSEPPAQSAQFALREFFASPDHRRTILNPAYRDIGVGVAQQGIRRYYTALFLVPPAPVD
jgi:uncharacterized protein YkwD